MKYLLIYLIFAYFGEYKVRSEAECVQQALTRCSSGLPMVSSPNISFSFTRQELDTNCIELKSGISCLDAYTRACLNSEQKVVFDHMYKGTKEAVNLLCTPGDYQEKYLEQASCVAQVRDQYSMCWREYELTLSSSGHRQLEHGESVKILCCAFQNYVRCSERTVLPTCGPLVANFTGDFLRKMGSSVTETYCFAYRESCVVLNSGVQRIFVAKTNFIVIFALWCIYKYTNCY